MTRFLRTVCLAAACTIAALSARADSTTLLYQGPTELVFGREVTVTAVAFTTETGMPLAGSTITFTLGPTSVSATVSNDGFASTTMTVAATPGMATMHLAAATGSLDVPVTVAQQPAAIVISSDAGLPVGAPHPVFATVVDADTGISIPSKLVRFTLRSSLVDVLADGRGFATTMFQLSPTEALGPQTLMATFAGDADVLPATGSQSVIVFEPSPFVIWGGNAEGVHAGDHVVFMAPDWSKQVTGGDFQGAGDFKGMVDTAVSLTEPCDGAACWTSKAGLGRAPDSKPYIGVLIATSIVKKQGQTYGNTFRIAIVSVDSSLTGNTRSGTVLHIVRPANQPD